jgi:hypothetical protein
MGKEDVGVRKILQPCPVKLLSGVALAVLPASASAASFSRCEPVASTRDCIPGSGTATNLVNNATINISRATGATGPVAFNWSVSNCFQPANQMRGQVMLIVDNSKSEETTDVGAKRGPAVQEFISKFVTAAQSSGVAPGNASYPQLAVTNYNGRSGTEFSDQPEDVLNARFEPDYCTETTDIFPSSNATARWGTPADSSKISICENLPFASAADAAAINNMKSFVDFAVRMPRGSTDFTYFFRGTKKAYEKVNNAAGVGRNVIVVTDGLPNVPKYVAAATCRNSPRLKNEAIVSGERLGRVQEYCVDRQAPQSIAAAHTEALTAPYGEVNVHHILFTENQVAYFDFDDEGKATLNPAGFLIENSARTGNGKVKFNYARGQSQLTAGLDGLFAQFDKNALRFVRVEVTPASGGKLTYNAVSPSAPGSNFDIKFVGLQDGSNTVKVTPVYQDGNSSASSTFTIVVGNSTDNTMTCKAIDEGRTVDGDLIGSKDPKGDGFYAAPSPSGQLRDYRNADEGNRLANEFGIVGESDSLESFSRLRLQGGTGNCGVIGEDKTNTPSGRATHLMLLLLAVPLLFVRRSWRRSADRSGRLHS